MKTDIFKRAFIGVAYGGIATFIALTVLMVQNITPPIMVIWKSSFAAFILGVYFGLASFIFDKEMWSPLKKTVVHFSFSIIVYYVIAFVVGWIPVHLKAIGLSFIIFSATYSLYWYGYWLYYKRVEVAMNEQLKRK